MSDLWTTTELKHYRRTGEEPGAQLAGKEKLKAARRMQPKRSGDVPLSVEAARDICKVKAALARDANVAADVAQKIYDVLLAEEEQRVEGE